MTSVSSISLNLLYKNYPVVLKFTWNDYNGLVWGQEANPVTNKSEYIREGYALRKSLTGPRYKKQKKENWMFRKVYKKISEGAWKMYNFNCLCNLWIWFTTKTNKVKLIFYQPSKEVIVPWARSPQQCFLRYYPWLIWPRWVCAADLGWWPFHPLEFWTGCPFGLRRLMKSSL